MVAAAVALAAVPTGARAASGPPAYELVSPVDKGATDVSAGGTATADGNAFSYSSFGTYPGNDSADFATMYRGDRTSTGWTTTSLSPRQVLPNRTSLATSINPQDFSADLSTLYGVPFAGPSPLVPEDLNTSVDVYSGTAGGVTHWLTPGLDPAAPGNSVYAGRSDDNRVVVFESTKQILPGVPGGIKQVYALVDGTPQLVSSVGGAPATSDAQYGGGRTVYYSYAPADRRAVSADGSRIFFTVDNQLYVRIDDERTVMVSASQVAGSVGDPAADGAQFNGASDDGHFVAFTSDSPLVDGATGGGLYGYDVDHGTLRLLAQTTMYASSPTVRTAPDGSRVYFTLSHAFEGEGSDFATNLWVVEADGSGRHFIGSLDGGDFAINTGGENQNDVAITPDGSRLAFASSATLGRYVHDGTTEVYVYDDDAQRLTCVSCPSGGQDPTGDASLRSPTNTWGVQPRNFTSGGGLLFETPERLTADDTDDQIDVYEYVDGRPRLVSTGTSTDTHFLDNSVDGSSIFLMTRDSLVAADDDHGYQDVYVVRDGGGFPAAPGTGCTGAACRPAPTPQVAPPGPGDTATAFDETPGSAPQTAPTFKVSSISAAAVRKLAHTGRLALKVRVSDAAVLTATGRAQIGKKRATVLSGTTHKLAAGTVTLTVRLSSAGRKALKRNGRLTVRLTVACSDTKRTSHATLVLRASKSTKKKSRS